MSTVQFGAGMTSAPSVRTTSLKNGVMIVELEILPLVLRSPRAWPQSRPFALIDLEHHGELVGVRGHDDSDGLWHSRWVSKPIWPTITIDIFASHGGTELKLQSCQVKNTNL